MTKKNKKLEVAQAGNKPLLAHNPFAALAGASAPALPDDTVVPSALAPAASRPPKGRLVLRREKKQRGGKTVVVISGFASRPDLDAHAIAEIAKNLKHELGCGGTVEDEGGQVEIVIQGDQPARVADLLRARGFKVEGVTR